MDHFLFAGYLILFAWLVTKVRFFTNSGLTPAQLIIFFLLKVMAGIFYGWIGVYYGELAQMVDTWAYHYESLKEYQLLTSDPTAFFSNFFRSSYEEGYGGFLASENSWWNDLKGSSLLKMLAFFNLLSFGSYYINVIFYSFITLFGPLAFYRIMKDIFPFNRTPILLATFLIPSFLYWTSGIHKDGTIFVGIALVCYIIYFGLKNNSLSFYKILLLLGGLILILALRNFLLITILPALIAWIVAAKTRYKPLSVFIALYLLFGIIFFSAKYIYPELDLPKAVSEKQSAFLKLHGGSSVDVHILKPTLPGFIQNAPQAFALSSLRPFPSDVRHLLSLAAAVEINLLLILFLIFLILRKRLRYSNPFLLFCFFFSLSVLMMIGYSVNFLGAIVRYRSIVLPLVIIPIVANIDWNKILNMGFYNIKKNNHINISS